MNSFDHCKRTEALAMERVSLYLKSVAYGGQFAITEKGPLSEVLQKTMGDVLFNYRDPRTVYAAEVKAEEENRHGNLFLETWSNRSRWTQGWFMTIRCDFLFYVFLDQEEMYVANFKRLRQWAFVRTGEKTGENGRLYDFPEKPQTKHSQLNDTWGRCVPIETLTLEAGLLTHRLPFARAEAV